MNTCSRLVITRSPVYKCMQERSERDSAIPSEVTIVKFSDAYVIQPFKHLQYLLFRLWTPSV